MNEGRPELVTKLLLADSYSHLVSGDIEFLETHISWVFLTGEYAYKIKRPVDFGFLDFTSLDKRKHFCQKELEFNQRFSPDLYLDVCEIKKNEEGQVVVGGSEGETIEYAVKMRQFNQDMLFSNLFKENKLNQELMVRLGKQVAEFHKNTGILDSSSEFGSKDTILNICKENEEQTTASVGKLQTEADFKESHSSFYKFLDDNKDFFKKRQEEGRIKECHGDLHLANVAIYQDQIQLFDCIEFNPNFSNTDVMYEVAFMQMDLIAHERKDLAQAFVNSYLEETGDYLGAKLLPFYQAMRAYIRGKISFFQGKEDDAKNYFKLALSYFKKENGKIYVVGGLSGSGKTTVSRYIASKEGALHLRSDAIRKHLGGVDLNEAAPQIIYSEEMTKETYQSLIDWGIELSRSGSDVILDAKFDRVDFLEEIKSKARENEIEVTFLRCQVPVDTMIERLEKRTGDVSDATPEILKDQIDKDEWNKWKEAERVVEVDTGNENWKDIL